MTKKIFIHRSAVETSEGITKGIGRNLYFINKSLGYDIVLMSAPSDIIVGLLKSEDLSYLLISQETPQTEA
ncbi:MAG: hypothetical protein PF444_04765, partial [Bacteroidales bacterium]|nr:hypothetical protein [Bacteroidales bacterium]